MDLPQFSFLLFTIFSGVRLFSYLPQIRRIALDTNKASAISYSTWFMWTGANLATALYAASNLKDFYLAFVSTIYAACCLAVIMLTVYKRGPSRAVNRRAGWNHYECGALSQGAGQRRQRSKLQP